MNNYHENVVKKPLKMEKIHVIAKAHGPI